MENPPYKYTHALYIAKLYRELVEMRDALTRLSCELHDLEFEGDVAKQALIAREVETILSQMKPNVPRP